MFPLGDILPSRRESSRLADVYWVFSVVILRKASSRMVYFTRNFMTNPVDSWVCHEVIS